MKTADYEIDEKIQSVLLEKTYCECRKQRSLNAILAFLTATFPVRETTRSSIFFEDIYTSWNLHIYTWIEKNN